MAETTNDSGNSNANTNAQDPSNFLTSPPSVVVKVVGTARDDINGLLGIVVSYNRERERYLVHMTSAQSTMALKRENLQKASWLESYQSQWQQLTNDPRVREKVAHYVRYCQQHVQPYNLWHVLGAVAILIVVLFFLVGFTKCLMTMSLLLLLVIIVLPDILARKPWLTIMKNFPGRARETLEQQMPVLRGRLSDRVALAIVMLVVAFCAQSLFIGQSTRTVPDAAAAATQPKPLSNTATTATRASSRTLATEHPVLDRDALEKFYELGFEDASLGKEKGSSIGEELEKLALQAQQSSVQDAPVEDGAYSDGEFDYYAPPTPPPPKSYLSRLFNFSSMGSMFYIYRMLKEKGTDQSTGIFSAGQLAANLQHHTELWQQAMLLFSVYNLARVLVSWDN